MSGADRDGMPGSPQGVREAPGCPDPEPHARPAPWHRVLRRLLAIPLGIAILDYLVLPQLAGTGRALHLLERLRPTWAVAAVCLEAASLVCFSLLTRRMLSGGPRLSWVLRTDLTGLAVSHLVPGSGAATTALRCRLLHEGGAPLDQAVVGVAVESVGSMAVLVTMLWAALVASLPVTGFSTAYLVPASVAALLLLALGVSVAAAMRAPTQSWTRVLQRCLPARLAHRLVPFVVTCADRLRTLLEDRRGRRRFLTLAAANWALDAVALWVCLAAFGWRANPISLLVAYGLANAAAGVPVTPGGLGVVEGVLVPTLAAFGGPTAVAALGVVSWRLIQFWAPIPVGGACYAWLRAERWRTAHRAK